MAKVLKDDFVWFILNGRTLACADGRRCCFKQKRMPA